MKHLLLLFLIPLRLLSQPNIDSYALPQDYNHFIYFLQKSFSKDHQKLFIVSKKLDITSLKTFMIKNSTSNFNIFVEESFSSNNLLRSLALHPHINIHICQEISKNMITFKNTVIKSDYNFDKKSLTEIDQKLSLTLIHKEEKIYLIKLKKVCKSY